MSLNDSVVMQARLKMLTIFKIWERNLTVYSRFYLSALPNSGICFSLLSEGIVSLVSYEPLTVILNPEQNEKEWGLIWKQNGFLVGPLFSCCFSK